MYVMVQEQAGREGLFNLLSGSREYDNVVLFQEFPEGMPLFNEDPYKVVFLAFEPPYEDSLEIIRKLLEFKPGVAIVLVTTEDCPARVIVKAMSEGACSILFRPVKEQDVSELASVIRKWHKHHETTNEVQGRLEALIDTSPNLFIMIDNDNRFLYANSALTDYFDLRVDQVFGMNFDDFIEQTADYFESPELYRRILRQEDLSQFERSATDVIELTRSGIQKIRPSRQVLTFIPAPIESRSGELLGTVWSFIDVTEIRKSTELLRTMVEFSPIPAVVSRLEDGAILFANEPLANLIGVPADKIIGQKTPDYYTDERTRDRIKKILLEKGNVRNYEVQLNRADGKTLWMIFNLVKADLNGEEVIIGSLFNIEERKRAEDELRWERNFVNAVVDTAAALIVVMDQTGNVIRFNRTCEIISGYSAEEVVGREFFDLLLPKEEVKDVRRRFLEIVEGQVPKFGENHWITRDGEERLISWSNTVISDTQGMGTFIVAIGIDITEARIAEERLRLYHRIFQAANDGIMIADATGNVLEINPSQRERMGDITKKKNLHEKLDTESYLALHDAIEKEGEFHNELKIKTDEGCEATIDLSLFPIHDDEGEVQYYVGMGRDITQRRKDQETIAMRLRYEIGLAGCSQTLLETGEFRPVLTRAIQHLKSPTQVDRVLLQLFAQADSSPLAPDSPILIGDVDTLPDHGAEIVQFENPEMENCAALLSQKKPVFKTKDDSPAECAALLSENIQSVLLLPIFVDEKWVGVLRFEDQNPDAVWGDEELRMLQTAAQMIGGYLARRKAINALQFSEKRFRTLVENIKDLIFSLDAEGRISYLSPQFEVLTGFKVEDYIGKSSGDMLPDKMHKETHLAWIQLGAGLSGIPDENFEFKLATASGEEKWFVSHSSTLVDKDGKVLEIIGAAHEITTLKKMMEDLEKANLHLRETQGQLVQSEKMASLGMLVAGIAHEINTPIGAVSSMHNTLMLALDKLKDALEEVSSQDDKLAKTIRTMMRVIEDANNVIHNGTERVTTIVRRLRSFARLDEAELKECNIHEGLEDTLTLVHHEIKHNITVNREFGDLPELACFPGQMNQVFLNILINAKQAIKGKGEITIKTWTEGKRAFISFTDTGVGIDTKNLAKIFDPGFTTKGVGVGTGLGLSICYQIMRDHHGMITVSSEVGKGTTFTLMLPTNLDEILENT